MSVPLPISFILPYPGASTDDEIRSNLVVLIDFILKYKVGNLLEAGMSQSDLFRLRRASDEYRRNEVSGGTILFLADIASTLDRVRLD